VARDRLGPSVTGEAVVQGQLEPISDLLHIFAHLARVYLQKGQHTSGG
jgi:hypothetical protein